MKRSIKLTICLATFFLVALPALSAMALDLGDLVTFVKFKKFCRNPVSIENITFGNPTHQLTPNEVTIAVDGTVTFTVAGGGHRIVIYPVSMNTERKDIIENLFPNCVDTDPTNPLDGCTAASRYLVTDANGHLIFDTTPITPPFETNNTIKYPVGRVVYQTNPADGGLPDASSYTYKFRKPGKYLVICGNRGHLHDAAAGYMFGFINVVDCEAMH